MSWLGDFFRSCVDSWKRNPIPAPPMPVPPSPHQPVPPTPQSAIDALNLVRMSNGRGTVRLDTRLTAVSQEWAQTMADNRVLTHGNFQERIQDAYPGRPACENVAMGPTSSMEVVLFWMKDAGHRENSLGNYTRAGVGIAQSSKGQLYWCLDLVLA